MLVCVLACFCVSNQIKSNQIGIFGHQVEMPGFVLQQHIWFVKLDDVSLVEYHYSTQFYNHRLALITFE